MPPVDRAGVKLLFELGGLISNQSPLLLSHDYSATLEMWPQNLDDFSAWRGVISSGVL